MEGSNSKKKSLATKKKDLDFFLAYVIQSLMVAN